jgi:DNA-binding protein HU-beta
MSREDLITKMAGEATISKKAAGIALNAIISGVMASLQKGEKVSLVGFGTFGVSARKARTGVNPQTGKKIQIKARKVPVFKPGKKLREAVK